MSKEARAAMFSVYLRPWTLAGKVGSRAVPHLADLADVGVASQRGMDDKGEAATTMKCIRKTWKAYSQNLLPHAARQISNFMLACLAEGRGRDRDDEGALKRAGPLTCEVTSDEITARQAERGAGKLDWRARARGARPCCQRARQTHCCRRFVSAPTYRRWQVARAGFLDSSEEPPE